jgi:hypothetical protein
MGQRFDHPGVVYQGVDAGEAIEGRLRHMDGH